MQLITLVGMPGGGKSTVGRHLARRIGRAFIDLDAEIERRIEGSIRGFFEREGEARFREIEAETLAEQLASAGPAVLATGGGTVLDAGSRGALKARSVCIYLRSTPDELFRRLRHDTKRPLLQVADPLKRLRDLFNVRDPLYHETAHFVVEIGRPTLPMLISTILMQLELAGVLDSGAPSPAGESAGAPGG